jgi:hypothetical protein
VFQRQHSQYPYKITQEGRLLEVQAIPTLLEPVPPLLGLGFAIFFMSSSSDLSVFDIVNIFRHRWFLSQASLLEHVVAAQKVANSKLEWVELDGPYHSHLVKCAYVLVPRPLQKVKKCMFVFLLEVVMLRLGWPQPAYKILASAEPRLWKPWLWLVARLPGRVTV